MTKKRLTKPLAVVVLVIVCALAVGWDWWSQRQTVQSGEAVVGVPLTAAQAEALAPYIHPAERLTVVHFWATWCPPCMVEMPHVLAALTQVPDGVAVTMVSLDDPAPAAFYAKERLTPHERAEARVNWVGDPQQVRAKAVLGKVMLPTTLIVERASGRVLQQIDGPLSWGPLMKVLATQD